MSNQIVARDNFDMWLQEEWDALIGPSPLLAPSPPGYFEAKATLDKIECSDRDAQAILNDFTWLIG